MSSYRVNLPIALFLTGCVTYSGSGGLADTVGSQLNYVTKSGRLAVMVLGDASNDGSRRVA